VRSYAIVAGAFALAAGAVVASATGAAATPAATAHHAVPPPPPPPPPIPPPPPPPPPSKKTRWGPCNQLDFPHSLCVGKRDRGGGCRYCVAGVRVFATRGDVLINAVGGWGPQAAAVAVGRVGAGWPFGKTWTHVYWTRDGGRRWFETGAVPARLPEPCATLWPGTRNFCNGQLAFVRVGPSFGFEIAMGAGQDDYSWQQDVHVFRFAGWVPEATPSCAVWRNIRGSAGPWKWSTSRGNVCLGGRRDAGLRGVFVCHTSVDQGWTPLRGVPCGRAGKRR
jgi:hypothetical protein